MRELTNDEIETVSGGVLSLGTGAVGAVGGGLVAGAIYTYDSGFNGNFTWGGFTWAVTTTAASGFLMGTGATLVSAGVTGAIKGAQVLGVSVGGAGAALGFATSVEEPKSGSGGS